MNSICNEVVWKSFFFVVCNASLYTERYTIKACSQSQFDGHSKNLFEFFLSEKNTFLHE